MCALLAAAAVYLGVWTWGRVAIADQVVEPGDLKNTASVMLGIVGWAIGLLVSGFPGVLKSGGQLTLPAPRRRLSEV